MKLQLNYEISKIKSMNRFKICLTYRICFLGAGSCFSLPVFSVSLHLLLKKVFGSMIGLDFFSLTTIHETPFIQQ